MINTTTYSTSMSSFISKQTADDIVIEVMYLKCFIRSN